MYFTNLPIIHLWVNYRLLLVNYALITVTENYGYFYVLQLCFGYGRLWVITKLRISNFFSNHDGQIMGIFHSNYGFVTAE